MKSKKSKIFRNLKILKEFSSKSNAKIRIVPIFLIIAIILSLTISSELNKQININLEFSNSTNYDLDNDGIETTKGVVDLTVENTEFNWNVNQEKLLTKWTITDEDTLTTTDICYGNNEGCAFIDLVSSSKDWNDIFYVNYGRDGTGYNNIVSSKIIYYDVDISTNLVEIYDSKEVEKQVKFYDDVSNDLSNLKVVIKDKQKREIGHHQIIESNGDYNLIISNKKSTLGLRTISTSATQQTSQKPESKVKINKIRKIEDIEAIIDNSSEKEITTDIIAINYSALEFENAEITLAKQGDVSVIMRCENFDFENSVCEDWQPTNIQFTDDGDVIRFNVTVFSAYGGSNITILNVHSYPPLYGNWTVKFDTTGKADLTIRAVNKTTWTNIHDVGSGYDLKFLELKCGNEILNYEWVNNSVVIQNYSCPELSYETQKELTTGAHYLEFTFGTQTVWAYNVVTSFTIDKTSMYVGDIAILTLSSNNSCIIEKTNDPREGCILSGSGCTPVVSGVNYTTCQFNGTDIEKVTPVMYVTLIVERRRMDITMGTLTLELDSTTTATSDPDDTGASCDWKTNCTDDEINPPPETSCTWTITGNEVSYCDINVSEVNDAGANDTGNIVLAIVDTTSPTDDMTITAYDNQSEDESPDEAWAGGIIIEWTASSSDDVYNYTIRRGEGSPAAGTFVFTTTTVGSSSYKISDKSTKNRTAINYYYSVQACDAYNNCNDELWVGPVNINAKPKQNRTTIYHFDETTNASHPNEVYTDEDLWCIGIAWDKDNESVTMDYNISILEFYNRGSDSYLSGTLSVTNGCVYIANDELFQGLHWLPAGSTFCKFLIQSSYTSKGDKISCTMTPYDGKQYGDSFTPYNRTYINNSAPYSSAGYITPNTPNESSTLTCNYTFYDIDTDEENVSGALFKWYIQNEGDPLNDFIKIPGKNESTLSSTFDKDDIVMCSVKVKDIDDGWLNRSLNGDYDDRYVNSTPKVIIDNAKPQIIDFSDSSNDTNPTTLGDDVQFDITWVDYEDSQPNPEEAQMFVCDSTTSQEGIGVIGSDYLVIGWDGSISHNLTYYTNLTGTYVETIAIRPFNFTDASGAKLDSGSTDYVYDIYAFEVDDIGDPINTSNPDLQPIAEDHNNAFVMGSYNYIKLQYNPHPLTDKRLAIVFCIDDNDENTLYCEGTSDQYALYINATLNNTDFNINSSNGSAYKEADIKINYKSTTNGTTSDVGCIENEYCHTDLSTDNTISCSYTTQQTNNILSNTYYVKACDIEKACSVYRQGTFWVNHKAEMDWVNLTTINELINSSYNISSIVQSNDQDVGISLVEFLASEKFVSDDNSVFNGSQDIYKDNNVNGIVDPTDTLLKNNVGSSTVSTNASVLGSSTEPFNTTGNLVLNINYTVNGVEESCSVTLTEYDYSNTTDILTDLSGANCNLSAVNQSGALNLTTQGFGAEEYINITGNATTKLGFTNNATGANGNNISSNWLPIKHTGTTPYSSTYDIYNDTDDSDTVTTGDVRFTNVTIIIDEYGTDFADNANLECRHQNETDLWIKDNGNLTFTFKWYVNRIGSFVLYDPNLPSDTNVLNNVHTNEGDQWICEVMPNDGFVDGIPKNSSPAYIGASSDEGDQTGIPYIINVTDNSNWTNPTTSGENITFQIAWGDSNSSQIYAFVCNSTRNISDMGCNGSPLAWSGGITSDNPVNVSFEVIEEWDKKNITAHIYIFDDTWISSSVNLSNFSVNIKPEMAWVNLTTTEGSAVLLNNTNIKCNHKNLSDSWTKDDADLTHTYKWYVNTTGNFVLYGSIEQIISHGSTNEGEQWICEVTPNDGFVDGTPMNSTPIRTIGESSGLRDDGIPEILNVIINSNATNPILNGSIISFEITWADANSTSLNNIFICNSTNVSSSGCIGEEFGRLVGPIFNHKVNITYIADSNKLNNKTFIYLYDDTNINSSPKSVNFTINHPPVMSEVNLTTTNNTGGGLLNFTDDANLNCTHNASDDGVNNGSDPAITYTYRWYLDRTGGFEYYLTPSTQQILTSGNTQEGDRWICQVTPNDGFVDGTPMNSTDIRTIGGEKFTADGNPHIINVTDNSDYTNPTTAGSMITFEIEWGDSNSLTLIAVYICNTTNVTTMGCVDYPEFARAGPTSANPVYINFTANENWGTNQTAHIYIYDDTWIGSSVHNESFTINHPPEMNWVNLTTTNGNATIMDDDTLNCTYQNKSDTLIKNDSAHNNATTLTFTYKWYYDTGGGFVLHSSTEQTISQWDPNTNDGDRWICEVTPNDGFVSGTPKNSSTRTIGSTQTQLEGIPEITNVITNSNYTNPTTAGSSITFEIYWTDTNSSTLSSVYICNSTDVYSSGCEYYQFGESGPTSANPVYITFTANESWSTNQTAHIYIYDDTWLNSSVKEANFSINHRPNATVTVEYISASSLQCYVQSPTDLDNESINTSLTEFKWWINNTLQATTSENLTYVSIPDNTFKCAARIYDVRGLSSADYISSPDFYGTDTIIAPLVWTLPEAVKTLPINIIGYINKSNNNLNVTAIALKGYNSPFTNSTRNLSNSTFIGSAVSENNFAAGNPYIAIYESAKDYFNVDNFIEFQNHNKTYFTRYDITGVTNLDNIIYKIDISPNLEEDVAESEKIYVYNNSKPTGWFNFSLQLFQGDNEIRVRGYENVSANAVLTGMSTIFNIYYDNQSPYINTSSIQLSSNENIHTINFQITDDFKINLSTLLINITNNTTYNVTHRYDSLVYDNESWNWGSNIICDGNNTLQDCNVTLNLEDGNYTIAFSVNDSVNNQNITTIATYLIDSTKPAPPTVYNKARQNSTNLSVLWKSQSFNMISAQYAVGNKTHRYPTAGWDSVISWTNTSENLSHKLIDSNNNNYPDKNETIIESADYNLSSNDVVNRTGDAALRNFLNGTEMFNDSNSNGYFDINDWIVYDDGNGIYNSTNDTIFYGNNSLPNGSSLLNFTTNFVYSDNNHDDSYTLGEAIINLSNPSDLRLHQGLLNGSGTDTVIVNGTADIFIPLTTINLSLINHEFYYVYVRYKNNEKLFYSLVGSSLVIKYSTTTGGITEEQENYTGPSAVAVYAPVESSIRTFTANWTESIDDRYNISYYQYSIGTAKYPTTGWNSIVEWTNNSLNRTASYASTEYTDGVYYYWNVRAINAIGNISDVNSSEGTLFHDQIPPIVTLLQVANDTNRSDGWLDNLNDNSTLIKIQGDENMTCFISPYDKWYSDYTSNDDLMCAPENSVNVTCNITDSYVNLTEANNYTYHIVCQDNLYLPNGQNKTQNLDVTFLVDWPTSPEVRNLTIWIYYANMTLRGNATNLSNTTYTNEFLECNGTYYDQDGDNFTSEAWSWTNNNVIIANANTSQLNLSVNGSKEDNITCFYNVTDFTNMNSTTYNYTVYINNTKPTVSTPIINSSALENRTNESLSCYVQSPSDEDNDSINYTYKWYKNNVLNTTTDNTNISYDVLGFGNTSKGDNWTCGVIAYDGEENGTAQNSTQLTIINTGPLFSTTINNISWDKNTGYTFDLDIYFSDIDNDNLTYNYTDVTNINVTINQTTGIVTLTPDTGFVGINSIRFNATDGEYWSDYSNSVTLNVTNTTINVTLNSPINNYNSSTTSITFNCSANIISGNNNLTNITLNIWNSTGLYNTTTNTTINTNSTNSTFDVTVTPDGDYTWNCQACNNESECTSTQNNYQLTIDTTYPVVAFSSETENNYTNVSRTWIYADVNVTESNEKNISFSLYNDTSGLILNKTDYATPQRTINWTGLSEGNYTYNVTVCDYVDYCNSTETRLIVLDTTPPNQVTGLTNTSTNESFVSLNWSTTTDNGSGVEKYIIYRNNTNIANTTLIEYNDSNVNSSSSYLYNVSAVDYAGNEGLSDSLVVNTSADLTAPVISNIANSSITKSGAVITWSTDDYANSTVYYGTNSSDLDQTENNSTLTKSHSITLSELNSSTTYYYQVNSSNREGLATNSSIYDFTTSSREVSSPPGGSGGGGGTPPQTATSIKVGSSFVSYNLEENDMLEFTLNGETHTIKMDEIEEDYVILIISSIPQTIKISLGETKKIDVNYDTKYDIEIKLISIVNTIRSKQATILIKGAEAPKALGVLHLPRKEEVKKAPPKEPVPKPKVEEYAPEKEGINILTYAISAFITIALIGSLVMKERMRINYMNNQPELRLRGFIKKAKTKGYKIDDVRKVLVSKGWPSYIVDSAALHDPISYLLKKGHNHTMVREILKSKGFSQKIIDNAILHNHITKELKKRRSLKSIRKELIKAGWNKKTIDKKLPAK